MSKVIFDICISLDGFITGPEQTADEPLGRGGLQRHEWAMHDERGQALLSESVETTGAIVRGRKTYDDSIRWWGADGPIHTFVDGTAAAIDQAKTTAGGKTVAIGGGTRLCGELDEALR